MNYYDKDEVLLKATGMWPHLLQQLTGLDSSVFSKKHQPCPICGGTDRFRFDDNRHSRGDGGYICNPATGCGAGDGLSLYMKSTGIEFGEAIRNLGDAMAMMPVERIELVRKQIKASQTLPKRAITFHEEATNILKCCAEHQKTPPFFIKHSKGLHRVSILNDFDSVYPVINAGGSLVNAAIVDPYGDVEFAGGIQTDGGFSVIGKNTAEWFLCGGICEAIYLHELTEFRAVCTWSDYDDPYFMYDAINGLKGINRKFVLRLTNKNFHQIPFINTFGNLEFASSDLKVKVNAVKFLNFAFPKRITSSNFTLDDVNNLMIEFSAIK